MLHKCWTEAATMSSLQLKCSKTMALLIIFSQNPLCAQNISEPCPEITVFVTQSMHMNLVSWHSDGCHQQRCCMI